MVRVYHACPQDLDLVHVGWKLHLLLHLIALDSSLKEQL